MIRPPRRRTLYTALVLGALVPLVGGCSFDRRWNRMASAAPAETADTLAGRWVGTWNSERSNHGGKLRAIITPADDATYRAEFDATYLGILRFGYSMNLAARRDGGTTRFEGAEDLGWIAGGLYRYDGTTDGGAFECTYRSKGDHGRFRMSRPAAKADPGAAPGR